MNLFDFPPPDITGEETVTPLLSSGNVRIERIVSAGQVSDWYNQAEGEFVALLTGEAELMFESGNTIRLKPGDTVFIEPHVRHKVSATSKEPPCVWLCVFISQ